MKFEKENLPWLGMMAAFASRYALQKALARPYSERAMRELRTVLIYRISVDEQGRVGIVNRNYNILGRRRSYGFINYETSPLFFIPAERVKLATHEAGDIWTFNDGCPPWKNREAAVALLATLERLIDFDLDTLPEVAA